MVAPHAQARIFMAGIPGTSAEEFEKQICGFVRPDAVPVPDSKRRLPVIAAKAPVVLATETRAIRKLHGTQFAWWRSEVLGRAFSDPPLVRLTGAADRFGHSISARIRTRFVLQGLQSQVMALAEKAGRPELGPSCFSGFGGVEETAIAQELWELSRGRGSLPEFLARYGFHGPAEGNPISRSWREDPSLVEALVAGLARRPDGDSPRDRERGAGQSRRQAETELLGRLPSWGRPGARLVFKMAATHARNLELGKAAFLMAIDGCRAAARDLGAQLVTQGAIDETDDVFFLTVPELQSGPPANAREIVAFRRARRAEYQALEVPVNFTGMPEPVVAGGPSVRSTLTGSPGGQGTVEGRAHVIHHPTGGLDLEPGSILVCRFTDPSWAPVFMLVDGLVIDLGGPASHGAIVARELGLPCVIGTGDGTARIRTGDRIRVDGDAGVVTILKAADESGDTPEPPDEEAS